MQAESKGQTDGKGEGESTFWESGRRGQNMEESLVGDNEKPMTKTEFAIVRRSKGSQRLLNNEFLWLRNTASKGWRSSANRVLAAIKVLLDADGCILC